MTIVSCDHGVVLMDIPVEMPEGVAGAAVLNEHCPIELIRRLKREKCDQCRDKA